MANSEKLNNNENTFKEVDNKKLKMPGFGEPGSNTDSYQNRVD
jgi:hypothetical protein